MADPVINSSNINPGSDLYEVTVYPHDVMATRNKNGRKFRCMGAGVLVIATLDAPAGRTLNVTAGYEEIVNFTAILAGTTVSAVHILV